jgi:L-alanine-DL-glutamate epimerase-like enolase superfamily enzyme
MSRIVRFEVGRFDYELVGEFKFFKTPARPSIVVRLTDENGVQGWGQSVPVETWTYETVETVETTLRHYLAPAILGAEPSDLAAIHQRPWTLLATTCGASRPIAACPRFLAVRDKSR